MQDSIHNSKWVLLGAQGLPSWKGVAKEFKVAYCSFNLQENCVYDYYGFNSLSASLTDQHDGNTHSVETSWRLINLVWWIQSYWFRRLCMQLQQAFNQLMTAINILIWQQEMDKVSKSGWYWVIMGWRLAAVCGIKVGDFFDLKCCFRIHVSSWYAALLQMGLFAKRVSSWKWFVRSEFDFYSKQVPKGTNNVCESTKMFFGKYLMFKWDMDSKLLKVDFQSQFRKWILIC